MNPIAIALAAAAATVAVTAITDSGGARSPLTVVDPPRAEATAGPRLGARLPEGLMLLSSDGGEVSLDEIAGERGVVVLFTRSADWCPRCRDDLASFGQLEDEIAARGYRLAGVTIDSPGALAAYAERDKIGYPLLADENSALVDALSLRDPRFADSRFVPGAPRVSAIVIDRDARVRAVVMSPGHGERPSDYRILAALDSLPSA